MKIYSYASLDGYPDGKKEHIYNWEPKEETCNERLYEIRVAHRAVFGGIIRNLKVLREEVYVWTSDDGKDQREFIERTISYEQDYGYNTIEIGDSEEDLLKFLDHFGDDYTISNRDGRLWLD